ncbi:hypothetical protein [Shewanella xiamenensis]|uniref:hypothetical protein n=1 Tax=Shewanella xiamenensis TaxID=332186 RepID=UPI0016432094|nr:hypothetical protein [Shewanella xiamenensis]TVL36222.1 hypothetical protein AYI95_01810 [Shewanella xiamenensis]
MDKKNLKKSAYMFDAKKNFFDLKVVQFCFFTISIISFACFLIIYLNSELYFDWSYLGFNSFVEIFKVPIAILALNIPIIAVLGAFHKSEQTRVQIALSNGQNNFSNYYKHLEEFKKLISGNYISEEKCEIELLHKKLFPYSMDGDYSLSEVARNNFSKLILEHYFNLELIIKSVVFDKVKLHEDSKYLNAFTQLGKIYEYLYYKGYAKPESRYSASMSLLMRCEELSTNIKRALRALSLIELIVYFDHTNADKSGLDEFLLEFDYDIISADIDNFIEEITLYSNERLSYEINTSVVCNDEMLIEKFIEILQKSMNISTLSRSYISI